MIKKIKMLFAVLCSALALFVVSAEPCYAEGTAVRTVANPQKDVTDILRIVKQSATDISKTLSEKALELLWGLALISLSFLAIKQILSGADFNTLFAEMIKFIMGIGFFVWILDPQYVGVGKLINFVEGWLNIIPTTNGGSNHTPEEFIKNIFNGGWIVLCWVVSLGKSGTVLDFTLPESLSDYFSYGLSLIVVAGIFVIFLSITANFILTLVKAYITICCGVLAVGFGGLTWTNSWAINYLKQLVKRGFELLCFVFIVDMLLGMVTLTIYNATSYNAVGRPLSLAEIFLVLTEAILTVILAHSVPPSVVSMIEGAGAGFSMSPAAQAMMSKSIAKGVAKGITSSARGVASGASGAKSLYNRLRGKTGETDISKSKSDSSSDSGSQNSSSGAKE